MKAFALFLQELNGGQTHAALTDYLKELMQAVQAHGKTGELHIKLKVQPGSRTGDVDKITVAIDRALKLPKPDQPTDFFWLTEQGEPTRKHPRQQDLDLRGVTENDRPAEFKQA